MYAILRKTKEPNLKKWQRNLVLGPILAPFAQIQFFFSKIWLSQLPNIMVSYHHVQYQKKNNDPILRKLSDGRIEGRASSVKKNNKKTKKQTKQKK